MWRNQGIRDGRIGSPAGAVEILHWPNISGKTIFEMHSSSALEWIISQPRSGSYHHGCSVVCHPSLWPSPRLMVFPPLSCLIPANPAVAAAPRCNSWLQALPRLIVTYRAIAFISPLLPCLSLLGPRQWSSFALRPLPIPPHSPRNVVLVGDSGVANAMSSFPTSVDCYFLRQAKRTR